MGLCHSCVIRHSSFARLPLAGLDTGGHQDMAQAVEAQAAEELVGEVQPKTGQAAQLMDAVLAIERVDVLRQVIERLT